MKRIDNRGLTLIELIVVIAVMAVLIGSAVVGVSLLSSGAAQKASKSIRSVLSEVRTNTLSIAAEWEAHIENDDGTYKLSVYRDGEEYDTTDLGSRIDISYGNTETEIADGEELVIAFKKSSGAVKALALKQGEALTAIEDSPEFYITVSKADTDYRLTLWRDTGKVTADN